MKAKRVKEFRSKKEDTKGQKRYQYAISGTADELARFKKQQGQYFLADKATGTVLWNRTEDHGLNPEIVETMDKEFRMVLDEEQVAYEKAEKRPLFAQMYFDRAQEQIATRGQDNTTKVQAPKAVADSESLASE